jgi:hypothetical protein
MVDGVLKTVAENKIKSLETEISAFEGALASTETFNKAAWAEYGSELCSGEMLGNELKMRKNINELKRNVLFLRAFICGNVDISEEDYLQQQCDGFDKEIARLNELKSSANGQLQRIATVKNLLAIEF